MSRARLGDMLVAAGIVTPQHIDQAIALQKQRGGGRLGEILIELGLVTEVQVAQVLSNQLSLPWVNLYHVDFSRELLSLLPAALADQYGVVPVYVRKTRKEGETLFVATADPTNESALIMVAAHVGMSVKAMVAAASDVRNAIRVYYFGQTTTVKSTLPTAPPEALDELEVVISEPPPPMDEGARTTEPDDTVAAFVEAAVEAGGYANDTQVQATTAEPEPVDEPAAAQPSAPERTEPTQSAGSTGVGSQSATPESAPSASPSATSAAGPSPAPSETAAKRAKKPRMITLTLLDGTTVTLPAPGQKKKPSVAPEEGLTTRDLIAALQARAEGKDVSSVLPDQRWEPLFAALLSLLLKKGLIADWEFVEEWNKHRRG